jgi:sarcosine oxidase
VRVAVIGCGAMGAATGWRLAARGAEVVCFDRHSPPHDLGSSHGESRITRTAYLEAPFYVPLLRETFPLWRELEGSTGTKLLTLTGALMIGSRSSATVAGALTAAAAHGLEVEVLDAAELRARYPGHVPGDDDVAVLDAQAGFLRPEAAIAAMIHALTRAGGEVRSGVTVTEVAARGEGVEVTTSQAKERFDAAVIATGAWMPELAGWLPLTVERQVLAWFQVQAGAGWLTPDRFPVFIRETRAPEEVYGFPTLDGTSLKIARHHGGEAADPNAVRRDVTDADLDPLRMFITTYLRGVTRHVTRTAVCMYTNTPDGHFIVDLHPDDPRIVLISACSGHGFKFAPVIGDIATDLVTEGKTARDISRFAATRFAKKQP